MPVLVRPASRAPLAGATSAANSSGCAAGARIVDLPLNATDDRVAGSVDIARALREGVAALEPGLLAEVNRGILYVDQINLLDDHLVDILLDAAALGVNTVEREGVSVSHPSRFLLIGTMNPEEGDLRGQLADRIGLRVAWTRWTSGRRAEVIRRSEAYTADPTGFASGGSRRKESATRLACAGGARGGRGPRAAAEAVPSGRSSCGGGRSDRADVTILQCSKARAALEGRPPSGPTTSRRPLRSPSATAAPSIRSTRSPASTTGCCGASSTRSSRRRRPKKKRRRRRARRRARAAPADAGDRGVRRRRRAAVRGTRRRDSVERGALARAHPVAPVALRRGKRTHAPLARQEDPDVAVDATVRAAVAGGAAGPRSASRVRTSAARCARAASPFDVCFVVDSSYSLQADAMVEKVKGSRSGCSRTPRGGTTVSPSWRFAAAWRGRSSRCRPTGSLRLASESRRRHPPERTHAARARLAGRAARCSGRRRSSARTRGRSWSALTDGVPNVPLRPGGDPLADALAQGRAAAPGRHPAGGRGRLAAGPRRRGVRPRDRHRCAGRAPADCGRRGRRLPGVARGPQVGGCAPWDAGAGSAGGRARPAHRGPAGGSACRPLCSLGSTHCTARTEPPSAPSAAGASRWSSGAGRSTPTARFSTRSRSTAPAKTRTWRSSERTPDGATLPAGDGGAERHELRAGFVGLRALASDEPTMLLGEVGEDERAALVEAFLDDARAGRSASPSATSIDSSASAPSAPASSSTWNGSCATPTA